MAASNKTANLQLNQWVGTDPFRMADFNEDNQKIDAAFGGMLRIAAASYVGDGAAERKIELGFTPKAVFVFNAQGRTCVYINSNNYYYGGLALPGTPCNHGGIRTIVSVEEGGFKVYYDNTYKVLTNDKGATLYYIAFG